MPRSRELAGPHKVERDMAGGNGGASGSAVGGTAGTDTITSGAGGAGGPGNSANGSGSGGGGGGAGLTGGSGGSGGSASGVTILNNSGSGGQTAAGPFSNGRMGVSGSNPGDGGGGGGGGGQGTSANVIDSSALHDIIGGAGGRGGDGVGSGGGGGGGAGGYGQLTGATVSNRTIYTPNSVSGGQGGAGGSGFNGGAGGTGGAGLFVAGSNNTINTMSLTGGNGGAGGTTNNAASGGTPGAAGAGGVGLVTLGGQSTVNIYGTISGGLSGDGTTRADAIDLGGGGNTLYLTNSSNVVGNIGLGAYNVIYAGTNSIVTGGLANFNGPSLGVDINGRLTLLGASTNSGTTNVDTNSTLQIGNGGTSGSFSGSTVINLSYASSSFSINRLDALTLSNRIVGDGSVNQIGTGTTTLSNNLNAYSGGTTINAGTLSVSSDGSLGAASGNLTFAGGTLEITAADFTSARNVALNTAGTVRVDVGNATLTGVVADGAGGAGKLTVTGPGSLTLQNTNTYTGGTLVTGGATLVANHTGSDGNGIDALGARNTVVTLDNGTLQNGTGNAISNGLAVGAGGGTLSGQHFTLVGAISDAAGGPGSLTFATSVTLAGDNRGFHGTSVLTNGATVVAFAANALSPNSAFQVGGGTTLDLHGTDQAIASLADGLNGAGGGTITSINALLPNSNNALTLAGPTSTTFSGVLQNGASTLGLTLASTHLGTTTLTGASTYTGATTINGGTLLVDGSLGNTAVTVASGAFLGGATGAANTGQITGAVTVSGTISAGATALTDIGTFTTGSLTLNTSATFHEDVGARTGANANADLIHVKGTVSLAGLLDFTAPADFAASVGQSLTLIDNDGADGVTGRFTSLHVNNATVALAANDTFQAQGHTYLINYHGGDGNDVAIQDITSAGGGGTTPTQPTQPTGPAPQTANAPDFGVTVTTPASTAGGVYGLYEALLGRAPDALGLEGFTNAVQNGASLADVANALLASGERAGMANPATDPTGFVQGLYQSLLGRAPDASGLQTFLGELKAGVSAGTVAVQLATSAEAQAHLAPTFAAGVFVPDAGDAGVARLYYGLLGRAPDAGGLQALSSFVDTGASGAAGQTARLAQVAAGIVASPEYTAAHAGQSDAAFVFNLYQGALGRLPDAGGQAAYVDQLAHGVSRATVALEIAESPEAQVHLVGVIEQGFHLVA